MPEDMDEEVPVEVRTERAATIAALADAFQRHDLDVFEQEVRPDMTLTLVGSSRLAGTYEGYAAFGRYLEVLREVLKSADKPITFEHSASEMIFRQVMEVMGPKHAVEMTLVVTVGYAEDGKIQSFLVEPRDQGLFDHVIDTSSTKEIADEP
jgi:ketosteroid isomerase-like protein